MLTKKELIAANYTDEEMKDLIEADSLHFYPMKEWKKQL